MLIINKNIVQCKQNAASQIKNINHAHLYIFVTG